ncbi:MAG: DUF2141 domain-containing protein, partial [Cyclobacteriaceae bacterium]|nr:DUF2141 domain-containing protein [Cyclobacteriaceae bacterium]
HVALVSLDSRTIKFISAKPFQNYYYLKTSKGIASYTIKFPDSLQSISQIGEDKASIKVYKSFTNADSVQARFIIRDSLSNSIDTTLYVKFNPPNPELRLDKFTTSLEQATILSKTNQLTAVIRFNKPVKQLNLDSLYYQVDSLTKHYITSADFKFDTLQQTIRITKILPAVKPAVTQEAEATDKPVDVKKTLNAKAARTTNYNELIMGNATLISIDQDSSASTSVKPKTYKEEDLAITHIESNSKAKHYFIELLDSKGTAIQKISNQSKVTFNNIEPGEYSVRLIEDVNNNGVWDAGNYFKSEEPEPIFYYYDDKGIPKFSIKANWEYGPLLISTDKSVNNLGNKDPKTK